MSKLHKAVIEANEDEECMMYMGAEDAKAAGAPAPCEHPFMDDSTRPPGFVVFAKIISPKSSTVSYMCHVECIANTLYI